MSLYPELLDSRVEIRILLLTQVNPLRGQLEVVPLEDVQSAPYTALSYTWKNPMTLSNEKTVDRRPSMPNAIEINGNALSITRNLCDALQQLYNTGERRLWIDAICINQENLPERGKQVGLMGRIYNSAKKVIVWLGPHGGGSELAMPFLARLATGSREADGHAWLLRLCEPEYRNHWQAIHTLLRRNWWRRAWVIQEVVLARAIEMACGDQLLSESQLFELQSILTSHWGFLFATPTIQRVGITSRDLERLWTPLRMRIYLQRGYSLGCLPSLFLTKDTVASDPRDFLFAKYGLIGTKAVQLYSPDYTKSVAEICTRFTLAYIQQYQDLSIICYAGISFDKYSDKRRLELPTWLPDWGPTKPAYPLTCSWSDDTTSWPNWKASGHTLPAVHFWNTGRILEAEGICVDAVDGVQFDPWCKRDSECQKGVQSKSNTSAFKTHAKAFEAFFRTVVADTRRRDPPLESVQASATFGLLLAKAFYDCDQLLEELQEVSGHIPTAPREGASNIEKRWHGMRHLELGGVSLREIVQEAQHVYLDSGHKFDIPRSEFPEWVGWEASFGQAMYHRRLFTTVNGYFGIGPRTLYAGDRICILKGCPLPLVVRPSGRQGLLHVVGGCYIQGYMDGEILEFVGGDDTRWEKLGFC